MLRFASWWTLFWRAGSRDSLPPFRVRLHLMHLWIFYRHLYLYGFKNAAGIEAGAARLEGR